MSGAKGPSGLTRRSFLKTTAAAAGVAAAAGAGGGALTALAAQDASGQSNEDQIFYGQCRGNCFSGCPVKAKVRNGKLVHTEHTPFPVEAYNRLCAKGYGHPQRTYSPRRIQYPMRLVGERGSGEWERISWDEAIGEICEKWKKYQAESGDTSILLNGGSAVSGKLNGIYNVLWSYLGGSSIQYAYDAAGCIACQKVIGLTETLAGNTAVSHSHAKTILMMGSNAAVSQPNTFHFLFEAQDKGGKLIHIDPVYSLTSAKCDQYVPIRPATDAALLLGMINYVIEHDYIDRDYLLSATVAPYLVRKDTGKFLRASDLGVEPTEGPVNQMTGQPTIIDPVIVWDKAADAHAMDGSASDPALEGSYEVGGFEVTTAYSLLVDEVKQWTLEKSSEICDIPVETIVDLAETFVNNTPSEIYMCYGVNQYNEGHRPYHAALTLLAITGNFGKLGAGFGALEAMLGFSFYNPNTTITDGKPAGPIISAAALWRVMDEKRVGDVPVDPRSVFVFCHNPIANMTDRLREIETYRKMDLVVVADMWMTDTIEQCADIVLPVCGWFEQQDVCGGTAAPFIKLQEKAIEPLFESKNDFEIGRMLLDGMGFEDKFQFTQEEFLSAFLDNPTAKAQGYSWERLLEEKNIYTGEYIHGEGGVFPTETGKFQFYVENWTRSPMWEGNDLGDVIDEDDLHLPRFAIPCEAWTETVGGYEKNELSEKYPLIFTSIRNRFTTHSMHADVDWFKEVTPEPVMRLNPKDAEARGIKTGDYVRAFNDRGDVVMKASINNGVRPGMVVYPKGWQYYDFVKGHIANLTSTWMNTAAYNQYFFDALCEVERYEGGVN